MNPLSPVSNPQTPGGSEGHPWGSFLRRLGLASLLLLLLAPTLSSAGQMEEDRIAAISSAVVRNLLSDLGPTPSRLPDAVLGDLVRKIQTSRVLPEPLTEPAPDRDAVARRALTNIGKGVAIVVILLVLGQVLTWMDASLGGPTMQAFHRQSKLARSDMAALAALVPVATEEVGKQLGRDCVERRLAARATVTRTFPAVAGHGRPDEGEAYLVLITRRHRLKRIIREVRRRLSDDADVFPFALSKGYKPQVRAIKRGTRRIPV